MVGNGSLSLVIDLRSDTVTQPTPGMRRAIAEAVVGDEQKREDPTVIELERRVAELLGHEDAVFLPTATMANHIALKLLSHRGDVLIAERHSHVVVYEYGGAAVHAGLMVGALICFMVSLSWRTVAPPPMPAVAMSLLGSAIVVAGGFCGGTLVYRFGVGVSWRADAPR